MSVLRWFLAPPDDGGRAERATSRASRGAVPGRVPAFVPPVPPVVARDARRSRRGTPRPAREGGGPTAAPVQGDVVVLALPEDIEVAAGAVVARLRRTGGAPVACLWTPDEGDEPYPAGPSLPSAARAARGLAARGLGATALGGVVRVPLAVEPARALAQVRRVRAAVGRPVTIALTRRDPALDLLLGESAGVLVMSLGDAAMTELVQQRAALVGPAATVIGRPVSPLGRLGGRLGLAPPAGVPDTSLARAPADALA